MELFESLNARATDLLGPAAPLFIVAGLGLCSCSSRSR